MYIPQLYSSEDKSIWHRIMMENSFSVVVTNNLNGSFANHLPLLLDASRGKNGFLLGHMAKASEQWRHFQTANEVLCIFQGPHSYISPSWYETPNDHVPTWNYVAVHAYGKPRLIENDAQFLALLDQTTEFYEAKRSSPWERGLSQEKQNQLLAMIVGFEIEIHRLEGKIKLSQNRTGADRQRVIEALALGGESERLLAKMMEGI